MTRHSQPRVTEKKMVMASFFAHVLSEGGNTSITKGFFNNVFEGMRLVKGFEEIQAPVRTPRGVIPSIWDDRYFLITNTSYSIITTIDS